MFFVDDIIERRLMLNEMFNDSLWSFNSSLDSAKKTVVCGLKTERRKHPMGSTPPYLLCQVSHCMKIKGLGFNAIKLNEIFKKQIDETFSLLYFLLVYVFVRQQSNGHA